MLLTILIIMASTGGALVAIYAFARPSVPKKYPIFSISDAIEGYYNALASQVCTIADNHLSLHGSPTADTFVQSVQTAQDKLDHLAVNLDSFDMYWQRFSGFTAQETFMDVCRAYSTARRKQIASAGQLVTDMPPFVQVTNSLKHLEQAAGTITPDSGIYTDDRLVSLQNQTTEAYNLAKAVQPHHPATAQYRDYILDFLQAQLRQLDVCRQSFAADSATIASQYSEYISTWTSFNDKMVADLLHNEFSAQTDTYYQALSELKQHTDPNN